MSADSNSTTSQKLVIGDLGGLIFSSSQAIHESASKTLSIDPLEALQELIAIAGVIVVIGLAWKFRKQVLVLVTGDDEIHVTFLGAVWWTCFLCCGQCSHEGTRCLRRCSCFPRRMRGAILARELGAQLGLAPHTIEFSNIVVGDLPFRGRGDFQLHVECSSNPPQTTSLVTQRFGKVVHFPEILTLRIRSSKLKDEMVRISVLHLNLIGSQELCQISIPAANICKWAAHQDAGDALKRFAMKPSWERFEATTPPWVALEFDESKADVRNLATLGHADVVRTATWRSVDNQSQVQVEDMQMSKFKSEYRLVNTRGVPVSEVSEENLAHAVRYEACCKLLLGVCNWTIVAAVLFYTAIRLYANECWEDFEDLTMAKLGQKQPSKVEITFPIGTPALRNLEKFCRDELDGTGLKPGEHWCSPDFDQVRDVCKTVPEGQPRPHVFGSVLPFEDLIFEGFVCSADACELHALIAPWDLLVCAACALLLLCSCVCLRLWVTHKIEEKKTSLMPEVMGEGGKRRGHDQQQDTLANGMRGLQLAGRMA